MNTFTLLTSKQFNARVKTLSGSIARYRNTVQTLVQHAVYHAISTRKADYVETLVNVIASEADAKVLKQLIVDHVPCIRLTTKDDNLSRVFTVIKGTKPFADDTERQAAKDSALSVIKALPIWYEYKRPTVNRKVNPVDAIASIDRMLTRAIGTKNKPGAGFSDEKTAKALLSFLPSIKAGINQSDLLSDLNSAIARLQKENDALKQELKTRKPSASRVKASDKLAA